MKKELDQKLIDKAPYMFVLMDKEKTLRENNCFFPIAYGVECGDGWFNILEKLIDDIVALDIDKEVILFQIKEKFGGLRFYIYSHPKNEQIGNKIYTLINDAAAKSFTTCEICGAPGKRNKTGWLSTLCEEHRR